MDTGRHNLHGNEVSVGVPPEVKYANDIRVFDFGGQFGFAAKSFYIVGTCRSVWQECLECDYLPFRRIPRLVDCTLAASSQPSDDLVTANGAVSHR